MRYVNRDYDAGTVEQITFNGKPVPPELVRIADTQTGELCFYVLNEKKQFQFDPTTQDAKVHTVRGTVTIKMKG